MRIAAAKRHEQGRAHFASCLNWWLARTGYSHAQIGAIADWALAQDGWLISSKISHLRNNNYTQKTSFTGFEALGAVNEALHLWKTAGPRETFRRYGPFDNQILSEELLDRGEWLIHPETGEPLRFRDFCELFVGHLKLPYAGTLNLAGQDARRLSDELGVLLDQLAKETGLGPRDAIAEVLRHYPIDDRERVTKLQAVLLGFDAFNSKQVERELPAISQLVASLRRTPVEEYGPQELYAELTKHRQRT